MNTIGNLEIQEIACTKGIEEENSRGSNGILGKSADWDNLCLRHNAMTHDDDSGVANLQLNQEEIKINQNKPWREIIKRRIADGGNDNESEN